MFGLNSLSSAAFADDAVDSTVGITAVTGTGSVGSVSMGARTVALTGVTGTGSVGTVVYSQAVTGVTATGSVGNTGVVLEISLSAPVISVEDSGTFGGAPFASTVISGNVTTTSSQANLTANTAVGDTLALLEVAVLGVDASSSVGSVVGSVSLDTTGNTATSSVGNVVNLVSVKLTGTSATSSVGSATASNVFAITAVTATGSVGSVSMGARTVALTSVTATGTVGTVRTWEDVNTAETANWVDVLSIVYYEDSGAFSGGAMAATTIAGNIITLSRPDLPVTWTDVASTGTTTWYAIAA